MVYSVFSFAQPPHFVQLSIVAELLLFFFGEHPFVHSSIERKNTCFQLMLNKNILGWFFILWVAISLMASWLFEVVVLLGCTLHLADSLLDTLLWNAISKGYAYWIWYYHMGLLYEYKTYTFWSWFFILVGWEPKYNKYWLKTYYILTL